jgi:hypothetical protein
MDIGLQACQFNINKKADVKTSAFLFLVILLARGF